MRQVGVVARFDFGAAGADEEAVREFFRRGQSIVDATQPATTVWYAYRIGPTTYGAFAAFATDRDRRDLLAAGGPRAANDNAHLFIHPPTFELVDIVTTRPLD